jgi:hypothetical protein
MEGKILPAYQCKENRRPRGFFHAERIPIHETQTLTCSLNILLKAVTTNLMCAIF